VAPFDVHLVSLSRSDEETVIAEELYEYLRENEVTVLWDDRDERAGVKFADADLIGCPVRITVSKRSLDAGGVELKARWREDKQVCDIEDAAGEVFDLLDRWPGL
jgi:prolyl-tRNA synthetase